MLKIRFVIVGACLLAPLLLAPVAGRAADDRGGFTLFGEGLIACSTYLGAYATADLKLQTDGVLTFQIGFGNVLGWIQGYATRVNHTEAGKDDWYDMGSSEIAAWLASWCRDNTGEKLWVGMDVLTRQRLSGR